MLTPHPYGPDQNLLLSTGSRTERIVFWTAVLTPIWWLLGIQVLLYPAVLITLLAVALTLDKLLNSSLPTCAWAWFLMACVMFVTGVIGVGEVGLSVLSIAAQAVTFFKSYFLIFACLSLPCWTSLRLRVVTQAVAWMAAGYFLSITAVLGMLVLGIKGYTPLLAALVPGDRLSLRVSFASIQSFFGVPLPRTALYTPDPPILGACAVCCIFICLGETDRRLRHLALAGSGLALLLSFSRSAWVCLPLSLLVMAAFRSSLSRQILLWGSAAIAALSGWFQLTPAELVAQPLAVFTKARATSSGDRELVVRKTLEAWQESPWLGWGIIRGSVRWYTFDIKLGSFSTYASVLYLHGLVGFIVFLGALASTLWAFCSPAVRGNVVAARAFASLVALYLLCTATPLSWMASSLWFYFVWLGAALAETRQAKFSRSWQELALKNSSLRLPRTSHISRLTGENRISAQGQHHSP